MRPVKALTWLVVAALFCLGGTDAFAKEKKVDWSEYLEPKGGSKVKLTHTSSPVAKATKTAKAKKAKKGKKATAKKSKARSKSSKRRR